MKRIQGGLRPIDSSSTKHNKSSSSIRDENSENNLMTQLLKALGEMRPHLSMLCLSFKKLQVKVLK